MSKLKFQVPTGMHDILPGDWKYYKKIYDACEKVASFYGFRQIVPPILENTELFNKGTGATSDIVRKEMFSLKTKGGDSLTLRPEGTPGVARAYIEHGMQTAPKPVKLWYFGPFFRYERPQAGRYRQFYQFGFEVIGADDPVFDAQLVKIFSNILEELKIKNISIAVNSIGEKECRTQYNKNLKKFLKKASSSLCKDCKERTLNNPLRVLDCKVEKCQEALEDAPGILDSLCADCRKHFKSFLEYLDGYELPYNLNPSLVRGLDYYTKTVFEIISEGDDERRQNSIGAGGRYDGLVELLGGPETPAVGIAGGVERIIAEMKKNDNISFKSSDGPKVFIAQLGDTSKKKSLKIIEEFRKAKINISESFGKDSLGSQLKKADKLGVKYSLIIGQQEAINDSVLIRNMKNGNQKTVKIEKIVEEVKKLLK
jgi:histidyl-tRNA synthetase